MTRVVKNALDHVLLLVNLELHTQDLQEIVNPFTVKEESMCLKISLSRIERAIVAAVVYLTGKSDLKYSEFN